MLKDILLHLATGIQDDTTIDYAISVALAFDAHLAGAAFANDEVPAALLVNGVPPLWIDEYRQQSQDAAKAEVARFAAAVKRAGISAQAGWLPESLAGAANLFARMARRFDLSVVRRAEATQGDLAPRIIEAALFETGRPVLVVPPGRKADFKLERVMIGWDGSACAARAVADAMPFLQRGGPAGAGWLWPFAVARAGARGRNPERPRGGHDPHFDVALRTAGSLFGLQGEDIVDKCQDSRAHDGFVDLLRDVICR